MKWLFLAGAIALSSSAARADDNIFRNPTAGIQLTKPLGWVFLTAEQNDANLRKVDPDDPALAAAMARYATAPMVVLAKHPEPFADLNPSFKVNVRSRGPFAGANPVAILNTLLPVLKHVAADATVTQGPEPTVIDGLDAAHLRMTYTLRAGGATFPAASELWVVPRGGYVFMLGAGWRQDEATGPRSEIDAILRSVRLTP